MRTEAKQNLNFCFQWLHIPLSKKTEKCYSNLLFALITASIISMKVGHILHILKLTMHEIEEVKLVGNNFLS